MTDFGDVGEFHAKFGLHSVEAVSPLIQFAKSRKYGAGAGPQPWDEDLVAFRLKFLCEELQEFMEGLGAAFDKPLYDLALAGSACPTVVPDHVKMADALIDLVYVAMGTAHLLGYPWEDLWDEVQRANMAKQRAAKDGSDSVRGSAWDVVKPPGWQPPNIAKVLEKAGFPSGVEGTPTN